MCSWASRGTALPRVTPGSGQDTRTVCRSSLEPPSFSLLWQLVSTVSPPCLSLSGCGRLLSFMQNSVCVSSPFLSFLFAPPPPFSPDSFASPPFLFPPSSLPLLLSHSLNNIKVKQADSTFAFLGEGGAVTENTVFWKDCNAWNNDIWTGRHVAVIPALGGGEGVLGVWGLCELRLTWSRKQGFKQANRWTLSVHLGWFLLS